MNAPSLNLLDILPKLVIISCLLIFVTKISCGFEPNTPTEYSKVSYNNGFDSDVWSGSLLLNRSLRDRGNLYLHQNLNVILHETRGFHREWKYDEQLAFKITKSNSKKLDFKVEGEFERFQDQRSRSFQSDVRTFPLLPNTDFSIQPPIHLDFGRRIDIRRIYLGAGTELEVLPSMQFEASIGPLFEHRSGDELKGARMKIGFANKVPKFGLSLKSDGWIDQYDSVDDNGFSVTVSGNWMEIGTARDKLSCMFNQSLQREFAPGTGNYNQRRDQEFKVKNLLSTDISTPVQSVWTSELSRYRTIHLGSNADYMEFTWKNSLDFNWSYGKIGISTFGGLDLQEQKFPSSLSNGQRTRLGLHLTYFPSETDSLVLESVAFRYRYDTPDKDDHNDRDELRYKFTVHGGWKIKPEYGIRARLEADLRHFVYLFSHRSSENRWSRLFSLSIEIPWSLGQFENTSRFAIMSNYSVYDFVPSKEELSRVYRSFTATDTLKILISDQLMLEVDFVCKLDDHGRLHWSKWVEDVSENGYGYSLSILPAIETKWYLLKIGWRWQERHTTLHLESNQTTEGESIQLNGPEVSVKTNFTPRLQGEVVGRYLKVNDLQRGNYRLPDFDIQLIWALG